MTQDSKATKCEKCGVICAATKDGSAQPHHCQAQQEEFSRGAYDAACRLNAMFRNAWHGQEVALVALAFQKFFCSHAMPESESVALRTVMDLVESHEKLNAELSRAAQRALDQRDRLQEELSELSVAKRGRDLIEAAKKQYDTLRRQADATHDMLASLQWSGKYAGGIECCPCCGNDHKEDGGHKMTCDLVNTVTAYRAVLPITTREIT